MTAWTEKDIPALTGRTALVTGANSGLGLETARMLAAGGARVLLACRNRQKAEAALASVPGGEVVDLDLGSLDSVEAAASEVASRTPTLDLLVNNAGVMATDRGRTEDGFETQIGINHLGHFALTARLMPLLAAAPAARVVTVSSMVHRAGRVNLGDLMFEKRRYERWLAYGQSKLVNLLFALELDRRLTGSGSTVASLAAHPGASRTNLGAEGTGIANWVLSHTPGFGQSAAAGALPQVRAAVDPAARSGQYYGPRFMMFGPPVLERPSSHARREADAARLWDLSESLTGVGFDPGR